MKKNITHILLCPTPTKQMIKNLKYHFATKNEYRNFVGLMLDNKFDSIYRSSREYIFLEKNITQMILMSTLHIITNNIIYYKCALF